MSDWQPIETAPRDGTPILGFDPGWYRGKGGCGVMLWAKAVAAEPEGWMEIGCIRMEPSHWMPLPPPPDSQ